MLRLCLPLVTSLALLGAGCAGRTPAPAVVVAAAKAPTPAWDPHDHRAVRLGEGRVVKAGWRQIDLGAEENYERPEDRSDPTKCPDPDAMTTKGTVDYRDGVWTLTGSGEGFWHGWDQGNLVHFERKIRGDFTFTAEVIELRMVEEAPLNGVAQAVLNVRDALTFKRPTQSFVAGSAPKAFVFQGRFFWPGDKHNQWWYWPERKLPDKRPLLGWIRLERRGDALSAYHSVDGREWGAPVTSNNPNHPFPLRIAGAPELFVGLACSARNDRNLAPFYARPGKTTKCRDPHRGLLTHSARCVFRNVTLTQP